MKIINFFKMVGLIILSISLMFLIQIPLIILLGKFVENNPNLGISIVVVLYNSLVFGALYLIIKYLLNEKINNFGLQFPTLDTRLIFFGVFAHAILILLIILLTPGKFIPIELNVTFETLFFQAIVGSGLYAPIVEEMIFHGLIYHI